VRTGRPSIYTPELANRVCDRIACGESIATICKDADMPCVDTIFQWLHKKKEDFSELYARARESQTEKYLEEIIEISDDNSRDEIEIEDDNGNKRTIVDHDVINRARLRVDARKWAMSKLAPKKYGEKMQQEISVGEGFKSLSLVEIKLQIQKLIQENPSVINAITCDDDSSKE
jgi:hypothetical protein